MPSSWEYKNCGGKGGHICKVKIDGMAVQEIWGETKQEARDKATAKTIKFLKTRCYTIVVKNKYLSGKEEIGFCDLHTRAWIVWL